MKNMKVASKLLLGFTIVALLTAIVGIMGMYGITRLSDASQQMYENHLIASEALGTIREVYQKERVYLRDMYIYIDDPVRVQESIDLLNVAFGRGIVASDNYRERIKDPALESAFIEAESLLDGPYNVAREKILEAAVAGDAQGVLTGIEEAVVYAARIESNLAIAEDNHVLWAAEEHSASESLARTLSSLQIAIIVVACVAALLLGIYISGLISKPIRALTTFMLKAATTGDITLQQKDNDEIAAMSRVRDEIGQLIESFARFIKRLLTTSTVLEQIAGGDLTAELDLLSDQDSIGLSVQKMVGNLNGMFGEINAASERVSLGAGQISGSSHSLAQGSTEQASAIQQLSAAINEIAGKTQKNASMAKEAADLSMAIKGNAEKGSAQMEDMTAAMKEINEASNQIGVVISVIDNLAFQTNILALNASVEAARAGSAGSGFAVVAEEVRNLAVKSAEAAKNTSDLIANSVAKATLGLNIVTETSASFKEITQGINHSAELVEQIATSSDGQAEAISQINIGIDQVAQVVQHNSATAEENAAASQEMNEESGKLSQMIAQFRLQDSVDPPAARERPVTRDAPRPPAAASSLAPGGAAAAAWGKY